MDRDDEISRRLSRAMKRAYAKMMERQSDTERDFAAALNKNRISLYLRPSTDTKDRP